MEIKTINYKRVHSLGNYNTEHLEIFAELAPDDDVDHCAVRLKNHVETALGIVKTEQRSSSARMHSGDLEPVTAPKPLSTNYDQDPF